MSSVAMLNFIPWRHEGAIVKVGCCHLAPCDVLLMWSQAVSRQAMNTKGSLSLAKAYR